MALQCFVCIPILLYVLHFSNVYVVKVIAKLSLIKMSIRRVGIGNLVSERKYC